MKNNDYVRYFKYNYVLIARVKEILILDDFIKEKIYLLNNGDTITDKCIIKYNSDIKKLINEKDIIEYEFYGIYNIMSVNRNENGMLFFGEDEDGDLITLKDVDIIGVLPHEVFEMKKYKIEKENEYE